MPGSCAGGHLLPEISYKPGVCRSSPASHAENEVSADRSAVGRQERRQIFCDERGAGCTPSGIEPTRRFCLPRFDHLRQFQQPVLDRDQAEALLFAKSFLLVTWRRGLPFGRIFILLLSPLQHTSFSISEERVREDGQPCRAPSGAYSKGHILPRALHYFLFNFSGQGDSSTMSLFIQFPKRNHQLQK